MNEYLDQYLTAASRFDAVVQAVPRDRWAAPSPCDGWSAADVVDHVVDTQRDFLDRHGLLPGDRPAAPVQQLWARHVDAVREAVGDGAVLGREFDGYFGRTTIGSTLASFYGFDMVVHRWDLAAAAGLDNRFTDDEMDEMEASIQGFGDHLYADGVCAGPVEPPPGASRQERILGLLGRVAVPRNRPRSGRRLAPTAPLGQSSM